MRDPLPYRHPELIFGLVGPVGTDLRATELQISKKLGEFGYRMNALRLSGLLKYFDARSLGVRLRFSPEYQRISTHMDAGDALREKTRNDALVLHAMGEILRARPNQEEPFVNTVHVLNSLKHPEEVRSLRRVYGPGFFLIGVYASQAERERHLSKDRDIPIEQARRLIKRDSDELLPFGQQTAETFHQADVFIREGEDGERQLSRFLDLLFSNPFVTPTFDENAMFLAYSASLRSSDLSRQVGATVVSRDREVIATGANDVPKFGGGQYWNGDQNDARDWKRGYDSNKKEIREILNDTLARLGFTREDRPVPKHIEDRVRGGRLYDLTEFGRAVHGEMAALLACARRGVSPLGGAMYVTTFPCHNCAKHIIAAGIKKVFYVEPYAKSRAIDLHDDAITLDESAAEDGIDARVKFLPFIGVSARRYVDLFSLKLSSGTPLKRQEDGVAVDWEGSKPRPRLGMAPASYIQRERIFATELLRVTSKSKGRSRGRKKNK